MRLVNIRTHSLESYTKNIPRYAILSHTWGTDADEVTFQEMLIDPDDRPPSTTSKAGYQKILKTCEIAQRYNTNHEGRFYYQDRLYYVDQHIEHVWIDTCCIDKSSSAELSEAINSMYKYYLEADVCFAYLSDMTVDRETFETSRWFTRGWTLQELVAPKRINFYDGSWTCRGDRDSLQDVIRRVTRISTFKNITELPVAVRMSWAAQRETTRDEDLAYCLMGIFDVNMPLLYGEGKKAFIRLQEEIIKQNPDLSIFAWTDPFPSMFSGLLAESPKWFRDGDDLEAAANIDTVYREFSVTNQGIRFQFPLKYHVQTGCLVLPLGHQSRSQHYPLGVFLRQISDDFCVRASPDTLANENIRYTRYIRYLAEPMTMQVPKTLSDKEIRDVRQTGITFPEEFDRLRSRGLSIGRLAPLGCWDPDTKTVHAGHKGIFECLLVFEMDQRCRDWNEQMGPSWTSFGVIFKYEARQEYNRRWLYKVLDRNDSFYFENDAHDMLKQLRNHGDYTNGLEEDLVVPGGIYVEGLLGMQQLSLRLVPRDYTIGAEWRAQSEDPQIYKGRRVGLEFKWAPIRELSGEHDQRLQYEPSKMIFNMLAYHSVCFPPR